MTGPTIAAGWYPDPGGSGGERYWDGTGWTAHCRRSPPKPGKTPWVWIAVVCVAVLVAVVGVVAWRVRESAEADRWTGFPRTIACHVAPRTKGTNWIDVPSSLLVKQVAMSHAGDQRLQLKIEFTRLTPLIAGFSYGILVMPPDPQGSDAPMVAIDSPHGGQPWRATLDRPDHNLLVSVSETASTVTIEVDLAGQTKLLGDRFTPTVSILIDHPRMPEMNFDAQDCDWSTPATEGGRQTATPQTAQPPAPARPPTEALPPGNTSCGPDEATALQSALGQLAPEPLTGRGWSRTPIATNYDSCADLSTILLTIQGGTGSSPVQTLMFHRGAYLGTGTLKAYGFTSLNAAASTTDTVVLSYRTGQSCTACNDGTVTNVRYHWDGIKVAMLDPPPPG